MMTEAELLVLDRLSEKNEDLYRVQRRFFALVGGSNIGKMTEILQKYPEAVTWHYADNGMNAPVLMCAHDTEMIKLFLENKADVNAADRVGNTRLIECGTNREIATLLLDYGANINAQNDIGFTALMHAAYSNSPEVAALLLSRGADTEIENKDGKTAEMFAKERGFHDISAMIHEKTLKDRKEKRAEAAKVFHTGLDHDIKGIRVVLKKRPVSPPSRG